jgi:hypothetical protein
MIAHFAEALPMNRFRIEETHHEGDDQRAPVKPTLCRKPAPEIAVITPGWTS